MSNEIKYFDTEDDVIQHCVRVRPVDFLGAFRTAESFLSSQRAGGGANLARYLAQELLNPDTIRSAWAVLQPYYHKTEFGPIAIRCLLEHLSTSDMKEAVTKVSQVHLSDTSAVEIKNAVKSFILTTALNEELWLRSYADKEALYSLSPLDTYRTAFQMPDRIGIEQSIVFASRQASIGPGFWAADRAWAVFEEAKGNREKAIELHHQATKKEHSLQGIDSRAVEKVSIEKVKISCIVISYNDAELVVPFCNMVSAHCDQIIVNDGGSKDGTIEAFEQWGRDNAFDLFVIRDQQSGNLDRTTSSKNEYRFRSLGGIAAFQPDRRRTTTLIRADHDYILMLDLDDVLPPFPNMKTLVASSYGVEMFLGWKGEIIGPDDYREIWHERNIAGPILFKANKYFAYAGINLPDEYLTRIDCDIRSLASQHAKIFASFCFSYWHLRFLLDPRKIDNHVLFYGQPFSLSKRFDAPFKHYPDPASFIRRT